MQKKLQILRDIDEQTKENEWTTLFEQMYTYHVKTPAFEQTQQLIQSLKPLLKQERIGTIREERFRDTLEDAYQNDKFPSVLQLLGPQTALMGNWFIVLTVLFLTVGVMLTSFLKINATQFLATAAPLVGVLTLLYEYRARIYKVEEMECACRYSPAQVATARILIVLGYNIVLFTIATLLVEDWYSAVMWKLVLNWLAPLLLILGIALFASLQFGMAGGCTIAGVVWLIQMTLVEGSSFLYLLLPNVTGLAINTVSVLLGVGLICFSLRVWRVEGNWLQTR